MAQDNFDLIVVGIGGMGSAALLYAANAGLSVLGLDRYHPGHEFGSSHGQTRAIRQAYFEHPNYVPLALEAYDLWDEIEQQSRQTLRIRSGLLQVGNPESEIVRGVLESASEHDLAIHQLTPDEIHREYPWFRIPDGHIGLFEDCGGILLVEQCVKAMAELAQRGGAILKADEPVVHWEQDGQGIRVQTANGVYTADRLILSPGAWAPSILGPIDLELKVLAKHQHWFGADDNPIHVDNGCPTFFFETDNGAFFYGFPQMDERGVKIAEHSGGRTVPDANDLNREIDPMDLDRIRGFLSEYLAMPSLVHKAHSVCMYTMSPDSHFVVDQLPGASNVAFAAGLSGHGFKFAPVIGKYLVELSGGSRREHFGFLRCEGR